MSVVLAAAQTAALSSPDHTDQYKLKHLVRAGLYTKNQLGCDAQAALLLQKESFFDKTDQDTSKTGAGYIAP